MKKSIRLLLLMAMSLMPFIASAQVYVSDYAFSYYPGSFSSIASSGTRLTAAEDDDVSAAVSLPFTFPFGQESCTQVMVASNGQIGIGNVDPTSSGYQVHGDDMSIIVPLGLDLILDSSSGATGKIYYESFGTTPNQYTVIEYNQVQPYSYMSSNSYTFQVVLYESGDIEFKYDSSTVANTFQPYVFLHELGVNRTIGISGSWAVPSVAYTAVPITLSPTNKPAPGLTLSFIRPEDPSCLRPLNFACVSPAPADQVTFAWTPAPSTAAWEFRWDTVGTHVDSMRNVFPLLSDTFFVCSTMVSGGRYDVYVRTDCGSDYSFWQGPLTVTAGSYNMPVSGVSHIYACEGTLYDNGGATANYSSGCDATLVVHPTDPDSIVVLSGTLSARTNYDYLYIYDGEGTTGTLLYRGTGLNQIVPQIRSSLGPLTLKFQSSTSSITYAGFALHVSCQRAPLCRYVSSVDVDHVAGGSAFLSWEVRGVVPEPSFYQVVLFNDDDSTALPFTDTTTAHDYFFSYLNPTTHYRATVFSVCNGDTVRGDTVAFYTRCRAGGTSEVSGTGTTTTYLPAYSSWGNTFSQSIYTAAELTAMGLTAGPIMGITYNWSSGGSYEKELVIFLGHTTNSTFTSFAPLTGSMTQVYSGIRPTTHVGVTEYLFSTPFVWDGVSNLVLSSFVNQPSGSNHTSSGFYGYSTNAGATRSIYSYRDNSPYTVAGLTTITSTRSTSSYRPNVSFITPCDSLATCVSPNVFVSRVLSDTVELRWAAGGSELAWDVAFRADDDTAWTTVATFTSATTHTFGGLTPQTHYLFRIIPECGGDSVFTITEATTTCVPVGSLPFTENFENFEAPSTIGSPITQCWFRGTNYTYTSYPYLNTSRGHSGTKSLYFYSSGSYYSYLALPAIDYPIDTLQVSFAAYVTYAGYSLQVGVMTDPEDYLTFTPLAVVTPSTVNTWEMFEVPLSGYTGPARYIALAAGPSSYPYVDDIEVSLIPNCPRPTGVSVVRATTTTATVHWSAPSATYFQIEYGPTGFAHGTGTLVTSSLDSVNLYGLSHSTSYDVYIRGLCSATDTSNWSFVTSFSTLCGIIDSLPYSQNFSAWGSGTGARPNCWAMGGYSSYPYIVDITDDLGQVLGHSLYMYSYSSNPTYASLPELDSISYPINMVQTVFRAWTNNTEYTSYSHQLLVGLCTVAGDLSTFTAIDTFQLTANPMTYEVAFDTAAGLGKYVTFVSQIRPSTDPNYTVYYNLVYIDSIALELIPDCQSPNRLQGTPLSSSSAILSWNERNTPLGVQIEYGPNGFLLGTGTRVSVASSPYTATGLNPATTYQFYVRSICGLADTSQWSLTPGIFTTRQNPAQVPYFYDFESGDEWNNWQTCSNSTINWYRDTAAGNGTNGYNAPGHFAMFISPDSGATYATRNTEVVNASAYRDIDFGTVDSSYLLSFRAKAGGTTSAGYDGLMVFLVDPDIPVTPPSGNLESPWGNINNMTYLAFVRLSTNWNTYTAVLDTLTGVHRLAFYWFNQNTASLGTFVGGPGAIDDISITHVACPRPVGIHATHRTMASATVTWHGPEAADYRVTCRTRTGMIVASELVHTNSISFSGLEPATTYSVYVRRLCSPTDSSTLSAGGSFTTLVCNNSSIDTIGNPATTTTSTTLPLATYYSYSYTQSIIPSSQIPHGGEISSINLYYSSATALTSKTNCTIYLGHTTRTSFTDPDQFVDPSTLQAVYTGSLNCTQGWNTFFFETPFAYNGSSNLIVAIDDNSGNFNNSATFLVSPTSAITSLAYYSDAVNPDPTSASLAAFTGNKNVYSLVPLMSFQTCPPNACPTPLVRQPLVRSSSVTLRWFNTSYQYQVGYRRASTSSWTVSALTTQDTFHVLHNLFPNTDYVYRVRQYCDSTGVSNWYEGTFNTGDIPCLSPMGLEVTSVTNNKASFNWDPEENNVSYRLHVFNTAFDRVINRYVHTATVTGLEPNVTYYAAVQAECQDFDDPSEWSDTIRFTTDFCPDVTNLTYSNLQGNSVDLDWTEGGRAEQWEIQYGPIGFSEGSGITVVVDHHPYTLTGLTGETEYDIYVRAICGENFYSEHWSNRITIETPYSGLSPVADDPRLQLYPNPATSSVTLVLTQTGGPVLVTLLDLTGREVRRLAVPDAAVQPTLQLNLDGVAAGAYFVQVTASTINTIRKLIVNP